MKCVALAFVALAMTLGIAVADLNGFNDFNDFNNDDGRFGGIGQIGGLGHIGGHGGHIGGHGGHIGGHYPSSGGYYPSHGSSYGSHGKGIGSLGYSSFSPIYGLPSVGQSSAGSGSIFALFGFLFIFLLLIGNFNSSNAPNVTFG